VGLRARLGPSSLLLRAEWLNTLSNPKVPLHTRTKRSQRLLIVRTLIRRQSDLVAIELDHDRHLLETQPREP
jgi:hypothetical protein